MDGDGIVHQHFSHHHLVRALEEAGLATVLLDRNHHILAFSPSAATLFGLSVGCEGKPIRHFELSPVMTNLAEDLAYLRAGRGAVEREFCDPIQRWFYRRIYVRENHPSETIVITLRDISEQKRGQLAAEREVANYRSLAESLPDVVSRFDREHRHTFISPSIADIIDIPVEEYRGKTNQELGFSRELCERWDNTLSTVLGSGRPYHTEFNVTDRYGRERWFDDRVIPEFDGSGNVIGVLSIARDITELVKTRHALEQALDERETLLVDVHHRVKNNLFLLIGLLTLEKQRLLAANLTVDEMIASFDKVTARVHVISTIYTHLYENSEDTRHLSTSCYVGELVRLVTASEQGRLVEVETDLDDVAIEAHEALPLGLVVNEALSNAYKHAFPDGASGRVYVGLKQGSAGGITVTIADNGVGTNASDVPHSVGTQLIRSLLTQLGATISAEPHSPFSRGTVVQFTFDPNGPR